MTVTTPVSSMLYMVAASLVGSLAAVCLKVGAGRLHRDIRTLLFNYPLAGGAALFLVSSYFFVKGQQKGELTILYPMVSLSYVFTLLWSRLVFGEPFTRSKFYGLGMIICGIIILVISR